MSYEGMAVTWEYVWRGKVFFTMWSELIITKKTIRKSINVTNGWKFEKDVFIVLKHIPHSNYLLITNGKTVTLQYKNLVYSILTRQSKLQSLILGKTFIGCLLI